MLLLGLQVYVRAILPIGALFSVSLWLGNTAVMYISVAFAQMLKVRCPLSRSGSLDSVDMQPYETTRPALPTHIISRSTPPLYCS